MSNKNIFDPFKTPVGQFSYPVLFEPRADKFSGKIQYSIEILFEKGNPELIAMKEYLKNCVKEKFDGKAPPEGFENHIKLKDGDLKIDKKTGLVYPEYANKEYLTIRSNSEHKPQVYDQQAKPMVDPKGILGGDFGVIFFSAFIYNKPKWGMTALLRGVQLTKKTDKPFGGSGVNLDSMVTAVAEEQKSVDLDDFDLDKM